MSVIPGEVAQGTIYYAHNYKSQIERRSGIAGAVGILLAGFAIAWGAVSGPSQPENCSVERVGSGVDSDVSGGNYAPGQNTESPELQAQLSGGQQVRIIGGAACR